MHLANGESFAHAPLVFPMTSGMSLGEVNLGPVSVATSQLHPHAHDHQILTDIQARSEQAMRQQMGCISKSHTPGCDKTKFIFSGLIKKSWHVSHLIKLILCSIVLIFLTIIKMSLFSGKLGVCSLRVFPKEALKERTQDTGLHQTNSAWVVLWNTGVGNRIPPGKRTPPRWACLKRSEIDSWAS